MKALIVFYSRTGHTRQVAETLAQKTSWDIEEIFDIKNRQGILGYLFAGRDATLRLKTEIKEIKNKISSYDLVVIGTPVWSFNVSAPIRTFILENKNDFKKVAFFCTSESAGDKKTFLEMEKECDLKPISTLSVKIDEIKKDLITDKIEKFIFDINNK